MKKIIGLLLVVLFFSACQTEKKETIKIGVILPLSGDGASYGKKILNGINLGAEMFNNEKHNVIINIITEDSKGLPELAVNSFNKLTNIDDVKIILGDAFSSPTLAFVPIADKKKIIVISPTSSSPKLSGASKYFFRIWPSDMAEGSIIAEVAINQLKRKSFVILYVNNEYGLGLFNIFSKKVTELGGNILTSEAYEQGETNFKTQLSKIKKLAPDAIYLVGYYKEFTNILIQAKEIDINSQFLSCGTFHEPEIIKIAGTSAENVIFVQPYFNRENKDSLTQLFVSKYETKYNDEAGVYSAHGFDAIYILGKVLNNGFLENEKIREGLLNFKNIAITGKITFIEGGDVNKPARIMTVKNGKFVDL